MYNNSLRHFGGVKFRSPVMKQELTNLLEQHRLFNEKNMVRVLRQLVRHITHEIGDLLIKNGYSELSARHLHVFENLDAPKTNIVNLANRAGISKQAMSKLVKEVSELGFVDVVTDRNDSRVQIVLITDKGGRFLTDLHAEIRRYRKTLVEQGIVTEQEISSTVKVIQKMNAFFETSESMSSELMEN